VSTTESRSNIHITSEKTTHVDVHMQMWGATKAQSYEERVRLQVHVVADALAVLTAEAELDSARLVSWALNHPGKTLLAVVQNGARCLVRRHHTMKKGKDKCAARPARSVNALKMLRQADAPTSQARPPVHRLRQTHKC